MAQREPGGGRGGIDEAPRCRTDPERYQGNILQRAEFDLPQARQRMVLAQDDP